MKLKAITALLAAAVMAVSGSLCAFAEQEPPPEISDPETSVSEETPPPESETTPSETAPTETSPTETTTPTETTAVSKTTEQEVTVTATVTTAASPSPAETTSTSEEEPSQTGTEPAKVSLEVGTITNGRFDVKVNIQPEKKLTTAKLNIEFDNSVLSFNGSEINDYEIGGMPVDQVSDSLYTFSYINAAGTDFSGVYTTLHFSVKDDSVSSTVIYVTVETLEDMYLKEIPNIVQNGIVKLREDDDEDISAAPSDPSSQAEQLTLLHIYDNALPTTLGELGIPDETNIKTVKLLDETVARYEQGALIPQSAGETELIVKYITGKELRFKLVVLKAPVLPDAPVAETEPSEPDTSGRNLAIAAAVLFALAAVALEFIFIIKPFRRKPAPSDTEEEQEEFVAYDDDDAPELVSDPQEMFARRKRPEDNPGKKK